MSWVTHELKYLILGYRIRKCDVRLLSLNVRLTDKMLNEWDKNDPLDRYKGVVIEVHANHSKHLYLITKNK